MNSYPYLYVWNDVSSCAYLMYIYTYVNSTTLRSMCIGALFTTMHVVTLASMLTVICICICICIYIYIKRVSICTITLLYARYYYSIMIGMCVCVCVCIYHVYVYVRRQRDAPKHAHSDLRHHAHRDAKPVQSSHICLVWMSHVTYRSEACHAYHTRHKHVCTTLAITLCILSMYLSHVTYRSEACHADHACHKRVCNMYFSHVSQFKKSCHISEWVLSHTWHSNSTCTTRTLNHSYINTQVQILPSLFAYMLCICKLCLTSEWVMSHI